MEKLIRKLARHAAGGKRLHGNKHVRYLEDDRFSLILDAMNPRFIELQASITMDSHILAVGAQYDNTAQRWPSNALVTYYPFIGPFYDESDQEKANEIALEHFTRIKDELEQASKGE